MLPATANGAAVNYRTIDERIRAKAYELWEEDGRLQGCADEYWRIARTLVEAELAHEDGLSKPEPQERDPE
jgi:hypothetical protein